MSSVDELKAQGNAAFSAKNYQRAIDLYSEAIDLDEKNYTLYSNRSGSYCAAGKYRPAEADARKVIELKPDWVRGYTRLASALEGQDNYQGAIEAYDNALKIDPSNETIQSDRARAVETVKQQAQFGINTLFSPQMIDSLRHNPKTAAFFQDPTFEAALNDIKANPNNMSKYANDQRITVALQALLEPFLGAQAGSAGQAPGASEEEFEAPKPKPAAAPKPAEPAKASPQTSNSSAEAEKKLGNDAFSAGKYEEALVHYNKAIEIDPTNVMYYNNKGTALTKLQKYDEAVEALNEGITKGREVGAPFDVIAKAFTKIASAENARNDLDAAIAALKSSLLEKKDPIVKRQLNELEELNTRRKAKAYENPELAEKARLEGNNFFAKKDFPKAIEAYTEAIKRDPRNPAIYSNRCAAYQKLLEYPMALKDCEKALEIDPNYVKAHTRKAYCHYMMKEYHRAQEEYHKALQIDPNCADAVEGLQSVQAAVQSNRFNAPDQDQINHAMADPEIRQIMMDPYMQQVLRDMQENPVAAQKHFADPKIRDAILKLQAAGIVR